MRYRRVRLRRSTLSPAKQEMLSDADLMLFKVRLATSAVQKALEFELDETHEFDTCIQMLTEARDLHEKAAALHHEVYANPHHKPVPESKSPRKKRAATRSTAMVV